MNQNSLSSHPFSGKFRVLDPEELHQASGNNGALEQQLLAIVLDTLPTQLVRLQGLIHQRDAMHVRKEIHDLKGTLGALGCNSLYNEISDMERSKYKLDKPNLLQLYVILERVKLLLEELDNFSKQDKPISK